MAGPPNPFAGLGQRDGVTGSAGRGRGGGGGGVFGKPATAPFQPTKNSSAPRDPRPRGRGRGAPAARAGRGYGRGASSNPTWRKSEPTTGAPTPAASSPFAQLKQNPPSESPFAAVQSAQQSPAFSPFGKASPSPGPGPTPASFGAPAASSATSVDSSRDPRRQSAMQVNGNTRSGIIVEDGAVLNSYHERYEKLKQSRAKEREKAIREGQMADPNQPTSLNQAITPVGTCTSMCPEFERVERIVQKMVDKSEKYLHPTTNSLQNMELKMLKRFRRSAAGYDEQLPSDIRTPMTLLQTMNYLTRHVLSGPEPLGVIHKFVWDRTRSIRNDFSVQQVTLEDDVRIAVTCLERIARFHISSLHLLSSPANEEPFDRHQEREQLNNTMLSLMYYYDDNRGRISFEHEDEFRAYYIIFAIHDQRPDLEARVQKWPAELRRSPRVQVALELLAAAGNTWEYQGTLDAKRPNAIAQGFYARFFELIDSPAVSYLMACVAEIYFNHVRQTAIRSIWKGYCRYPASQQHKNEEWTVDELTTVLCFDDDNQTIQFCEEQDLGFAENASGNLYLNWGNRPIDSIAFQPSSEHSFSEKLVESKRAGRSMAAIILGLNIKDAASLGMIDRSLLSHRVQRPLTGPDFESNDSLFVSDDDNETPAPTSQRNGFFGQDEPARPAPSLPGPFGGFSQPTDSSTTSQTPSSIFSAPKAPEPRSLFPPAAPTTAPSPFGGSSPFGAPQAPAFKPAETKPLFSTPASQSANSIFSTNAANAEPASAAAPVPAPSSFKSPSPFQQPAPSRSPFGMPAPPTSVFPSESTAKAESSTAPVPSDSPFGIPTPPTSVFPPASTTKAEPTTAPASSLFKFPSPSQQDTAPATSPFGVPSTTDNASSSAMTKAEPAPVPAESPFKSPSPFPSSTPSSSPFGFPATSTGTALGQSSASAAGQSSTSIFDAPKAPTFPSSSTSVFGLSGSAAPSITDVQSGETASSASAPATQGTPSIFSSSQPAPSLGNIFEKPAAMGHENGQNNSKTPSIAASQSAPGGLNNIFKQPAKPEKPSTEIFKSPSMPSFEQEKVSAPEQTTQDVQQRFSQPEVSPAAENISEGETGVSTSEPSAEANTANQDEGVPASSEPVPIDVAERRVAWIEALKEAADRRRHPSSSSSSRKRGHEDQEPAPADSGSKPPKASKAEAHVPRKTSMALSSIKPLPKLPILERIEAMTARKPEKKEPPPPKPHQVDEDEMLLSAARIAAESLRSGPKLLDHHYYSAPYEPRRSSFSPGSSFSSVRSYSRSQSPNSASQVNGYDLALAPDTDLGLGRTLSRTEQRLRMTGGRGLAYKPLDFTPDKKRKSR